MEPRPDVVQLPRGKHRLTREQVLSSQRGRMFAAVAQAGAELGFAHMSVSEIIRRAGVSRETFYEQFTDKEDCFLQALDAGAESLAEVLGAARALPAKRPLERLDRVIGAYLDSLAAEPAFADAYLVGAFGAGRRAVAHRFELQRSFVTFVAEVLEVSTDPTSNAWLACEAYVAAISSLVTARVAEGNASDLPLLRERLISLAATLVLKSTPHRQTRRPARSS